MVWTKIKNKYNGKCIICNEKIDIGKNTLWEKGTGVKHEKCEHITITSNTPNIWHDPIPHDRITVNSITHCQCCNKLLVGGDIYNNADRRTCNVCFIK